MGQIGGKKRKMIDLNITISVIMLCVNGLIALIKRQKLSDWLKKIVRPNYMLPIRNSFQA